MGGAFLASISSRVGVGGALLASISSRVGVSPQKAWKSCSIADFASSPGKVTIMRPLILYTFTGTRVVVSRRHTALRCASCCMSLSTTPPRSSKSRIELESHIIYYIVSENVYSHIPCYVIENYFCSRLQGFFILGNAL